MRVAAGAGLVILLGGLALLAPWRRSATRPSGVAAPSEQAPALTPSAEPPAPAHKPASTTTAPAPSASIAPTASAMQRPRHTPGPMKKNPVLGL